MQFFRHDDFGSEFHLYEFDWNENGITLYIDGNEVLDVDPGTGFWDFGEFDKIAPGSENPWINSNNKMTPFDQEV